MAIMPIAPWTVAPDFLGAMRAGTSAGLEMRQQNMQESQAADRLRLAYDQLASEEQQRAQESQNKLELAHASLALKGEQMDALNNYRQGLLQNQEQRMTDLASYREKEIAAKQAAAEMARRNIHFGPNGEVLKYNPEDGSVQQIRPPNPAKDNVTGEFPVDPANPFGSKVRGNLESLKKQYPDRFSGLSPTNSPAADLQPNGFSLLHPSTWFGGSTPAAAPNPAAAQPAPFNEGQLIRNKSDGKLYKVVNGVPVPATAQDTQQQ